MDKDEPGTTHTIETELGLVTIRPARAGDAPAYRELRLQALGNHPEAFGSDYETNLHQPMSYWEERLRTLGDETMIYFAVHESGFAGMCGIIRGRSQKTRHSATIISVYVRPAWRGHQVADRLIEACIAWARDHGITIAKLAVITTNTPAIRCYARCGFTVYGIDPQVILYDGVIYDELLMARKV
jgi:GNAT superfamily N-acetyltransferase